MAEASLALGIGGEFDFRGKKYRLKPFGPEMVSLFECWLQARASQRVFSLEGRLDSRAFQRMLDAHTSQVGAGAYGWGGERAGEAAVSVEGQKHILYLMLSAEPQNEDVTEKLASDMMDEIYARVRAVMAESNGPNLQAPTTASATPSA